MKHILLMVILLPIIATAQTQKIAVIDRQLQKPMYYTGTMNMQLLEQGNFVMHKDNIKSVLDTIKSYRQLIDDGNDIPERMKSIITGNTYFTAGGDKGNYTLILDTKIKMMGSYYTLASKTNSKKENLAAIDNFISYMTASR